MKTCNKCTMSQKLSEFKADRRNKDGLQGTCKTCENSYRKLKRIQRQNGIDITPKINQICRKCKLEKPITDFYKDAYFSSGHSSTCKDCKNLDTMKWRSSRNAEYNEYMKQYRKTHPHKYGQARNRGLKHRYGIDQEQYDQIFLAQEGKCRICKKHQDNFKKPLFVDHSHETNEVRGLLCSGCNVAIAILDNPALLEASKDYLKKG